ncbi:glycosyltransferase family 4 protein [Candidatus Roizmanbacteria bacterium]|nr:glycosyltransferase family 4 protein [Candidatus Roizmanbacteria bacterium]
MKILLDTHMLGQKESGNERYWKNLYSTLFGHKNEGYSVYKYSQELSNGLYRIFSGFNKAIKSIGPDIIHVQNFTPFVKSVPIVNTVHDLCFKSCPDSFGIKTKLAFKFFFKHSLNLSDAIISVSQSTKKNLLRYYKVDRSKVFVIYEGVDPIFKYIKNKLRVKNLLKDKFEISKDYFLVVGYKGKRKRADRIIESFKELIKTNKNIQLVLVGPEDSSFDKQYQDLVIYNRLKILNYVSDEDLNLLYNGALSLINYSSCEGFGLPLIEAMRCKTPVICSDILVFREITDGSALFVNNGKELTKIMVDLIKNEGVKKKYSLLGYKRSKFFSWDKTAQETLKIYKWILETKK